MSDRSKNFLDPINGRGTDMVDRMEVFITALDLCLWITHDKNKSLKRFFGLRHKAMKET